MIAQSSRHALAALVRLAALPPDEFLGADVLAQRTGAPRNYLGKLLQSLAGVGILTSRKGPGGGFRLASPAGELNLLDVVEPLEDLTRWSRCFLGEPVCSDETACAVHQRWAALRDRYLDFLRRTTLADLVESSRTGKPLSAARGGTRRRRQKNGQG